MDPFGNEEPCDLPHLPRVPFHNAKVSTHNFSQIRLVYDEQIALRDARAALARDLVATAHVNDVDDEVGQLATVVGSKVVAAALDQQQFRLEFAMQILQRRQICRNILTYRGMRAATRLNCPYPLGRQCVVARKELAVLTGEDVVRHSSNTVVVTERVA